MEGVNIGNVLEAVSSELENTSEGTFEQEWGFPIGPVSDQVFVPDELETLKKLAKLFGLDYPGHTLETYVRDGVVKVSGPKIVSNGSKVVCQWGGKSHEYPDEMEVFSFKLTSLPVIGFRIPKAGFTMPIVLEFERGNDKEKEKAYNRLTDVETMGELKALLTENLEALKGDALWTHAKLRIETATKVEEEDRNYWNCKVLDPKKQYHRLFLSGQCDVAVGDVLSLDADTKTVKNNRTNATIDLGGFVKLQELEVGKVYNLVRISKRPGEFGGFLLNLQGVGVVGSNSQIERWITAHGMDCVSVEKPGTLKVVNQTTMRNKKVQVNVVLDVPTANSRKKRVKPPVNDDFATEAEDTAPIDDDFAEEPPAKEVKSRKSKKAVVQPELPFKGDEDLADVPTVADEDDDWLA